MAPAEKVQRTGVYIEAKSPFWGGGYFDDFWPPIAQNSSNFDNFDDFDHFGGVPPILPGGGGYIAKLTVLAVQLLFSSLSGSSFLQLLFKIHFFKAFSFLLWSFAWLP